MKDDDKLKEMTLVFYKDDVEQIEKLLAEFLRLSKAKSAILVDKGGYFITKQGQMGSYNTDTISALVAGSFAATKEMAKILGQEEFSVLYHQGAHDNIQLTLIGERTILAVIFDNTTTLGMVRLYVSEVAKKMNTVYENIKKRKEQPKETISKDFGKDAGAKLDDIFDEK
ncbi:MAG: roadblock/LC7 domain-containing protein [Planctomycetota bacterium]